MNTKWETNETSFMGHPCKKKKKIKNLNGFISWLNKVNGGNKVEKC